MLLNERKTPIFSSVLDVLTFIYEELVGGATGGGGTWGGSLTLPVVQPIVFQSVTGGAGGTNVNIPASINWKVEVLVGDGVTSGANTMDVFEAAYGDTRADGQAHLAFVLAVPENVKIRFNYQPIA